MISLGHLLREVEQCFCWSACARPKGFEPPTF